jgi:hypothetical protein
MDFENDLHFENDLLDLCRLNQLSEKNDCLDEHEQKMIDYKIKRLKNKIEFQLEGQE